ncbi:MAG: PaaI family thioesterase [Fusobacteria bacterium]|nr:PaaI family thioesterase [Fusobacteriota bacterium]
MNLMEFFEIKVTESSEGYVEATMPVKTKHTQKYGFLHGGATIALAETLAGIGSNNLINEATHVAAGTHLECDHLKPVKEGSKLTAEASIIDLKAHKHVWEVKVYDSDSLIHISKVTCRIVAKKIFE